MLVKKSIFSNEYGLTQDAEGMAATLHKVKDQNLLNRQSAAPKNIIFLMVKMFGSKKKTL